MSPKPLRRSQVVVPVLLAAAVGFASAVPAQSATTNPNISDREIRHGALARRAATEGMVLLDNSGGALPMADGGNVALFGVGSYATVKGGTGSGFVNNRSTVNVRQGLEAAGYSVTTSAAYWDAMKADADELLATENFWVPIDYSSAEHALTTSTVQPTAATDTAIFVVARNSGEGSDRQAAAGDYYLTDIERANVELIGQTYKSVIVVLNVGGIVDTQFFEAINASVTDPSGGQALDSLFLMSQAGQDSGNAVVDVLSGSISPSGKLTDTWASDYDLYPASATFANNDGDPQREEYTEGIYVGYRYFDSFYGTLAADPASVVNFPFGFGLSYTDFSIEAGAVTIADAKITVEATVTNTGERFSGKEVVQVYFSAPQTGLDKPYQELAGFAKTDSLAPGESQDLSISFDIFELSSYDESAAAYTIEGGDYVIRVGNSSRNTSVASVISLASTTIAEQLSTQADDEAPASELTSDPANFYSYDGEAAEIAAAPRVVLAPSAIPFEDNTSPYQQNVAVGADSPYYPIDGSPISSVDVYLDPANPDWEGTGAAYPLKPGETVVNVTTDPDATLYDVYRGTITMEQFVAGLSLEQLANVVEGASAGGSTMSQVGSAGYTTPQLEELGIASVPLVDGPAGVRATPIVDTTPETYQWATAFPIGTLLSQTFNMELIHEVGEAVGAEMIEFGSTIWLAPSFNLHRDPLNGRNFEYHSEDPMVSGLVAAAISEGVQSHPGLGVAVKHYAANNQETARNTSNSVLSERNLREMYLRAFEIVVKQTKPMAIMSSYNRINGTYVAGDYDLLYDILRGEWGFEGVVMTDWGGIRAGAINTMYAGNDLIMPGLNPTEIINEAIQNNPQIDINGLPVQTRRVLLMGTSEWVQTAWAFNSLTPSPTGSEVFSTVVNADTDLTQTPLSGTIRRNAINNEEFYPRDPYTSVNEAYEEIMGILAQAGEGWSPVITSEQAAAITISDVVREDPADDSSPVVSYTVTVRGDYPSGGYNMRLGDLQRSARNVLNIVMQSAPFKRLAAHQGVQGITVAPYADQFDDAHRFLVIDRGSVRTDEPSTEPTTPVPTSPVPTSPVPTAPVPTATVTLIAPPDPGFKAKRPYEVPGYHEMNGRRWFTDCENYSQTVRCRTDIWSTMVRYLGNGKYVSETNWHFNNLTYLPYMTRAQWASNPLGHTGSWTSTDGRRWRTECDTAATGRGGCRSYIFSPNQAQARQEADGSWIYFVADAWLFNNMVRFRGK